MGVGGELGFGFVLGVRLGGQFLTGTFRGQPKTTVQFAGIFVST